MTALVEAVPRDIWLLIFTESEIDAVDLIQISRVCKQFHILIRDIEDKTKGSPYRPVSHLKWKVTVEKRFQGLKKDYSLRALSNRWRDWQALCIEYMTCEREKKLALKKYQEHKGHEGTREGKEAIARYVLALFQEHLLKNTQDTLKSCQEIGKALVELVSNEEKLAFTHEKTPKEDAEIAYCLGLFHLHKIFPKQNKTRMVEYFQAAADLDHAQGQYMRARCYDEGNGGHKSVWKAEELYKNSASQNNKHALVMRAKHHIHALEEGQKSAQKLLETYREQLTAWLEKAAQQKYLHAYKELTYCYKERNPLGISSNLGKVFQYNRLLAKAVPTLVLQEEYPPSDISCLASIQIASGYGGSRYEAIKGLISSYEVKGDKKSLEKAIKWADRAAEVYTQYSSQLHEIAPQGIEAIHLSTPKQEESYNGKKEREGIQEMHAKIKRKLEALETGGSELPQKKQKIEE